MKLRLEVVGGTQGGKRFEVTSGPVTVGRHPACDLQFDPREDRVVSGRHVLLVRREGGWLVRDLGSENGTWVDGEEVTGERRLRDGDEIRLGRSGPALRVRLGASEEARATLELDAGLETDRPRVGAKLTEFARRYRLAAAVALAAVLGLSALYYVTRRGAGGEAGSRTVGEADPAVASTALVQRADGSRPAEGRTVDSLQGRVESLQRQLRRSRRELDSVQQELRSRPQEPAAAGAEGSSVRDLERRLRAARAALSRYQLAAEVDFATIEEENWRALAQVYAQRDGGGVNTGTAFGVRSDGLLVTSRHVVVEEDGRPRSRVGVQFARSEQVWPAEVVAASESGDLALVRVRNVQGEIPTVEALNARADTLAAGVPLVVLGYSMGGESPAAGSTERPLRAPLTTVGLLKGRSGGTLEIQGLGERGGSGSPIFDSAGEVVAVLQGGRSVNGEKLLTAIPVRTVRRLLAAVAAGPRR